jgi:hypothetical protein
MAECELEIIWKEAVVAQSEQYSSIYVEGIRKTTKIGYNSRSLGFK